MSGGKASCHHLGHSGKVIIFIVADFEFTIFSLIGDAVGKDDHRPNDILSTLVRYVIALDATRWII